MIRQPERRTGGEEREGGPRPIAWQEIVEQALHGFYPQGHSLEHLLDRVERRR